MQFINSTHISYMKLYVFIICALWILFFYILCLLKVMHSSVLAFEKRRMYHFYFRKVGAFSQRIPEK